MPREHPLPPHWAVLAGKVDYVQRVSNTEYSSSCPQCGGTPHPNGELPDRCRLFVDEHPTLFCRKCGLVAYPDQFGADSGVYHRLLLHNILAVGILSLAILMSNYIFRKRFFSAMGFVVFYSLHIILDMFDNGVPLLYPVSRHLFLIFQIGDYVGFPLKLVYEGSLYFSLFGIILYTLSLLFFLFCQR